MAKLLKHLVVMVLAIIVMFISLSFESGIKPEEITTFAKDVMIAPANNTVVLVREGESTEISESKKIRPGDEITTDEVQSAYLKFDEYGEIRIAPSSRLIFREEYENGYVFDLSKGRAWVNNLYTASRINVIAGGALMMPRNASFDLEYDGVITKVKAFRNHVNVGLVNPDYAPEQILQYKDPVLINSFLVAQGSQASVYLSKVVNNADALSKLLYSKLIKEFQYGLMNLDQLTQDKWISFNLQEDEKLNNRVSLNDMARIDSRGLKFSSLDSFSYSLDQLSNSSADLLTFSDKKHLERLMNSIFDHLLDAEYLLVYSRNTEAAERLNLFTADLEQALAEQGDEFKSMVMDKLRYNYFKLNYVLPSSNLFDAKEAVGDMLIANLSNDEAELVEKLDVIRDYLNYAYVLAESDTLQAKLSLEKYYIKIKDFISGAGSSLGDLKFLVSEDNQIMDNLLKQYSQFYQDGFFAMKSYLENEWLKLLPEGTSKMEEQQTIISTKIDFLKQLQSFFLDQKVALSDAKKLVVRLINEIRDLQTDANVAVSDLFELRLKDYGNFLQFLNSTSVSSLRGGSIQDQYNKFLAAQQEQVTIEQAIDQFFGETEPNQQSTVTANMILEQTAIDFEKVGVTDLKLGGLSSVEQQYIDILSGRLGDVQFSAKYDWDKKQISQIRVGTRVVSQNPIRLSNLPLLFAPKEEETEEETPTTAQPEEAEQPVEPVTPQTSSADRVAKILLLKKLQANDVTAAEENIEISDAINQIYVVNGAVLLSNPNIQTAFRFNNKTDAVSSLIVRTPAADVKLDGTYSLSELSDLAADTYNANPAAVSQ